MTDKATFEQAPVTEGAMMRATSARHLMPWLIGLAVLVPLPWFAVNDYQRFLLDLILINVILAVGLNIVKGFAGQVTVGHIALMAIGAYSSAVVSTMLGFPFWFALPTAMAHTAPGFLHPNNYTINEMITVLLMVVFGGIGHVWGGVIGAIVVTLIDDFSSTVIKIGRASCRERV